MSLADLFGPYGRHLRQAFYLVTPRETTYTSLEDVPPFLDETIPWFLFLIALDALFCWKKGMKDAYNINDFVTSLGAGYIQTMLNKVALRTIEITLYAWVYEHWSIYRLPAESAWTWLITFVVVDFFYYWMHRGGHEINIFWAIHQTHHSSEYYNLSTALRQGAFQQYVAILFYLPQAFFIPPPMHMVHEIINRLYQFWIHTPLVDRLGPLELILNTPSHHRVHHGRNRYCIDKNYAGALIIWDRMFGTFQPELDSKPVYGLTHNINTYDAMEVQLGYLKHLLFEKVPSTAGLTNKLKALFYGPGWSLGKPRLGDLEDIPEPQPPVQRYDSGVPAWVSIYTFVQGGLLLIMYESCTKQLKVSPWLTSFAFGAAMIVSVYILGRLIEKQRWGPQVEIIRCLVFYFWFFPTVWPSGHAVLAIMRMAIALSAFVWIFALIAAKTAGKKLEADGSKLCSD